MRREYFVTAKSLISESVIIKKYEIPVNHATEVRLKARDYKLFLCAHQAKKIEMTEVLFGRNRIDVTPPALEPEKKIEQKVDKHTEVSSKETIEGVGTIKDGPIKDETPIVDETVIDGPIVDETVIDEPIVDETVIDEPIVDVTDETIPPSPENVANQMAIAAKESAVDGRVPCPIDGCMKDYADSEKMDALRKHLLSHHSEEL